MASEAGNQSAAQGTEFEGKSRRLKERVKLSLPVRVQGSDGAGREWVELSRLLDVTPFGAGFTLAHMTDIGRLLHLTLPMPRQLRCFDYVEQQYRVWGLVRRFQPHIPLKNEKPAKDPSVERFDVGVAFVGRTPPPSYEANPMTRYEVAASPNEAGLWELREIPGSGEGDSATSSAQPRFETRIQMAVEVIVQVISPEGAELMREETVTENISRRGACIYTGLRLERGQFVRVTALRYQMTALAVVRAHRVGADGIPRLHLEFIDRQWPLDGIG